MDDAIGQNKQITSQYISILLYQYQWSDDIAK